MINNLYTLLADLARDNDPELVEFLGQYTRTSVKSYYPPEQSSGSSDNGSNSVNYTCFISMVPTHIETETAKVKIQDILKAIARGETCSEKCADNIMASYLTRKGNAKFWQFLRARGQLNDVDFSNEFVSSAEDLQSLFRGMPTHKIVVSEILDHKAARGEQKFKIELVDRKTNNGTEIRFPNNDCYLLYLWFLMFPRQMIMKSNIQNHFDDIGTLAKIMYQDTKKIDEKIDSYKKDPTNTDRTSGFEKFFTQNLSKVNAAVRQALNEINDEDGWYIIGQEPDGYSISLTDDKQFIDLPDVLEKLKHQFTI